MPRKVVWSSESVADVLGFVQYLETDNPATAMKVAQSLIETGDILKELPHVGRSMNDGTGRHELYKNINSLRYVLRYHYDEGEGVVSILRVWHVSENRELH